MYRISDLLKQNKRIYHTQDLAILWHTFNKNTLYTTIKRYIQKGILFPIYKGMYSVVPPTELDPLELGVSIVHRYTYLSTETVLFNAGIISQSPQSYTFISDISKKLTINGTSFMYRKLKDLYLHNPMGIEIQNNLFIASPERAAADILYFNPKYHFDIPGILNSAKLKKIQKEVGYI